MIEYEFNVKIGRGDLLSVYDKCKITIQLQETRNKLYFLNASKLES